MQTKDIKIEFNGKIFRCHPQLTVSDAINEIRSRYCRQGGGIDEDTIPVVGSQVIGTLTGALSFTDCSPVPTQPVAAPPPAGFPGEFDASTGVRNAKEQSFQSPTSKLPGPKVVTAGLAQYTRRPLSFSSLPQPLSCETLCLDEHTFYDPLVKCSFEWMKLRQSASEARTIYGAKVFCRSAFSRLRLPATCKPEIWAVRGADQPLGVAGFSVEAKSINALAIEEVLTYCSLSMLDCFFPDIMPDNELVMVNHVPVAFGVVSSGPMGFVIACEWVGFLYYSVVSEPFFLGSENHETAIRTAEEAFKARRAQDGAFQVLRIPYSSNGFRNKSDDDVGIVFSNAPLRLAELAAACQMPTDTAWFVKVVSALNYLDRWQFPFEEKSSESGSASESASATTPAANCDQYNRRFTVWSEGKDHTYGAVVQESPHWSLGPLYMYHLFKVYARLKNVMNGHEYPPSLLRSHLLFGLFDVAIVTPFVGHRDANEEDMKNRTLMQQVAKAIYWLAAHAILYIDVRPANIRISSDSTSAYLIDYDDCVLLDGPLATAVEVVDELRKNVHSMQWMNSCPVLLQCILAESTNETPDVDDIAELLAQNSL